MIDLRLGDCLEELKKIPENNIDSVITDPPYELGFMGKAWDNTGIAYNINLWKEVLRVLKPGGHLLSFGGSRTYHRMACAIEDAGFEIRDQIMWVYGSGFPKSHNIGLRLDQKLGLQGFRGKETSFAAKTIQQKYVDGRDKVLENGKEMPPYEPKSEIAKQWNGWGTALKPAHEPIVLARKPLSEKTIADNVLKWGVGGININGCRVGTEVITNNVNDFSNQHSNKFGNGMPIKKIGESQVIGRFPANFIHDGSDEVVDLFPNTKSGARSSRHHIGNPQGEMFNHGIYGKYKAKPYNDAPVDIGSAARFFYCAKASKSERNIGCERLKEKQVNDGRKNMTSIDCPQQRGITFRKNSHPTVKPIALMKYLITLVSRENQIVLDPFMGSGTTGIAAKGLGRNFIGIEINAEYMEIAKNRIGS